MKQICHAIIPALLSLAACFPASLLGQTSPGIPRDFGNWLRAYGDNVRAYQSSPGFPMAFRFAVLAGGNLVSITYNNDPRRTDALRTDPRPNYSSSVIPTPGLCAQSTSGTSGVRCAADAHFAVTGQGEALNQSIPRDPSIAAQVEAKPHAASTSPTAPLPTFRLIPFPPVFPNQTTSPPSPPCDAVHDDPLIFTEHLNSKVSVIGSCSGKMIASIPVTDLPLQVDILPDSSQALVTSFDSAITFIDLSTFAVTGTIHTDPQYGPAGIAISPDGARAYVASLEDPGALLTIDVQKRQIVQTLPLPRYPQSLFLTPDGSLLWVTFALDDQIVVIDTLTNTIVKNVPIFSPGEVAFNSTGTLAFITSNSFNAVNVLNTTTYATVRNIPVGNGPLEIGIAPDDTFAVVTNHNGQSLTVIDLNSYATTTIPLPGPPLGLSLRY